MADYSQTPQEEKLDEQLLYFESKYKGMSREAFAEALVNIATRQATTCYDFKKPRIEKLDKYWRLYDGKVEKKIRQLFNVPIPVFPGMIDTLNAQYDTPVLLTFKEGDSADYFKVQKIQGAWNMEVMNTTQNSKWDSKLRMARTHAIMNGRAVLEYNVTSDPAYKSELSNVVLKDFNFQPRGGLYLENHLFAGTEDVERTQSELVAGAASGFYDKAQVKKLLTTAARTDYLPGGTHEMGQRLARFKPLGLDPENHTYVGQTVFKLVSQILEVDGQRWYICFDAWTKTWLRCEKWAENGGMYPWVTYATHEDSENFLSKSYADDIYAAADAVVAMFNQELTNREKRNFGARAYDREMFPDVRKLDEAMHRPDALVPADTKGGTRQISQGVYEFKVGELGGTINLIDWITGSLGRNTGATDLAMGGVQEVSKKASVTFAEQKSVSKRIGWGAQPFQDMMADLGKRYIYGLKDHMPSKMAIRVMGEGGWDWDEITRLDLSTTKDVDVLIVSSDKQVQESEVKAKRRAEALAALDPNYVNPQKVNEEKLRSIGGYEESEIAEFMDVKTYQDRKSLAKASESIQLILRGREPLLWYGANIAFVQKIVDYASDKRSTLKDKFQKLIDYANAHQDIVRANVDRAILETPPTQQQPQQGQPQVDMGMQQQQVPGGISRAMNIGEQMTS